MTTTNDITDPKEKIVDITGPRGEEAVRYAFGGEKRKIIFESKISCDHFRVVTLRLKPGEVRDSESHPPSIVVVLDGSTIRMTSSSPTFRIEQPERDLKSGDIIWSHGETHTQKNVGGTELRAIIIELPEKEKTDLPVHKFWRPDDVTGDYKEI